MAKNNKTRFFYVLYSDKTRVFDQSERAYYPIYIIKALNAPIKVKRQGGGPPTGNWLKGFSSGWGF